MTIEPNGIPRFWKILFTVEIALCIATAAYWVTLPEDYALGLFGLREIDLGHRMLLQQNAAVLAFAYGWFYARLLYSRRFDLRIFRFLQEALALGDIYLIGAGIYLYRVSRLPASGAMALAQAVMAAVWLGARIVFIIRHGGIRPNRS